MSQDQHHYKTAEDSRPSSRPTRVPWPPLLLAGAIAGAIILQELLPMNWPGLDDTPSRIVGLGIGLAGILLISWAAYYLCRAGTTILPHKGANTLVTGGPFTRFRNPIYLGDVMILLGTAELTKNIWFVAAAAVFAIIVTFLAILPEEHHLAEKFGNEYKAYKARSRRWI